jgi:hypothetical protein
MVPEKDFRENLFFEAVREFWNERGRGARYRLTTVGVSFFKDKVKLGKSREENIESFKKYLIDNNYCKTIEFNDDEFSFSVKINDCCLMNIRKQYEDKNMEILSCPIANMFMYIYELETGMSPELLPVEVNEGQCKLTMGKMGTDKVTEVE